LTGSGFSGATQVWFGGALGTGLTVASDTTIHVTTPVTTPPQPVGAVGVAVITPTGNGYRSGAYTYT
jgi:hypothetical protein